MSYNSLEYKIIDEKEKNKFDNENNKKLKLISKILMSDNENQIDNDIHKKFHTSNESDEILNMFPVSYSFNNLNNPIEKTFRSFSKKFDNIINDKHVSDIHYYFVKKN